MIGVLCPSLFEYRALQGLQFPRGQVHLCVSGMGKVRALYACHELKKRYPSLKGVLLIGFAGGLTRGLKIGDLIEPGLFIEHDYDARPLEKYPHRTKNNGKRLFKEARDVVMLTQDRFLTKNPYAGNEASFAKNRELACDMESYAVAYFCNRARIRYSIIKLISDVADENADHDFLKACRTLAPKLKKTVYEAVNRMGS